MIRHNAMDSTTETEESGSGDICRVCRMDGSADRPLFYPCVCTGSIKYVHQECLLQWLKYSKKEYCELCNHKYKFQPIYHPDMPRRLPVGDLVGGMGRNVMKAVRCWLHYTLVAIAWLGIVPLTASRIYHSLFTGSVNSLLMLPLDLISTENILTDCLQGGCIIVLSLCAFIALVWLREQIIHGGPAHWLELDPNEEQPVEEEDGDAVEDANNNGQNRPADGGNEQNPEGEADNQQQPQQQEDNWQPFEWDRAADDLTWERLLGLDGSLIFLEHVFWVISLNTLFMLVFAFSPYHVGHFMAIAVGWLSYFKATYFEGVVTTVFGYFIICAAVFLLHKLSKLFRFRRAHRAMGMCYLALKVFLLILMEIGLFPLACGWWLDICSLSLFHSTLRDRSESFLSAAGTSMFVHWLIGMVYVFYFASFILLLREVLRPGVLWFLRNLNDPEFNPIQEMIQFPVYRHARRFLASLVMFAVTILLLVYCPIKVIQRFAPSILPYNISLNAETPLSELSLELLLLQVVLPALLEQSHARQALKGFISQWCRVIGSFLDLKDYLLPVEELENDEREDGGLEGEAEEGGDAVDQNQEIPPAPPLIQPGNLGMEHQALLLVREPVGFQPYRKPRCFPLRLCFLLLVLSVSALVCSVICFSVPVSLGRWGIRVLGGHSNKKTHELYTVAAGLYLCWVILRLLSLVADWIPRGWRTVASGVRTWVVLLWKCVAAAVPVVGVIPFMMGLLFQLVIVAPMRVTLHQSPLFFPWQDWAMGILHCKIVCAGIMMGPDWWMKQVFERLYQDGFRNMNVKYLYGSLVVPVVAGLGLAISVPYALSHTCVSFFGVSVEEEILLQRHIYPCLLLLVLVGSFLGWQFNQITGLVIRIRNEKWASHTTIRFCYLFFFGWCDVNQVSIPCHS